MASKILFDVYTLYPPEISIAPVAPLAGDEQLPANVAIYLGEKVNSPRGIVDQCDDASSHACGFKFKGLSFPRDARIKIRDDGGVG